MRIDDALTVRRQTFTRKTKPDNELGRRNGYGRWCVCFSLVEADCPRTTYRLFAPNQRECRPEREREREREGVAHFVEVAFEKIQKYNDGDMVKNKWETSGVRREP